jgi:PAS domain-containing protein
MITFTPATYDLGDEIAERLRELDRRELECTAPGRSARDNMRDAIALSDGNAMVALADGEPIAALGVSPHYLLDEGIPWMLGTDEVAKHPRDLVCWARQKTAEWLEVFPVLMNEVWTGNKPSITFLRHAGFTFAKPRQNMYGAEMALFFKRRT